MATIKEDGTYRSKDGKRQFFFRKGHELLPEVMDDLELVEPADRSKGAPEKRSEKPAKAERKKAD